MSDSGLEQRWRSLGFERLDDPAHVQQTISPATLFDLRDDQQQQTDAEEESLYTLADMEALPTLSEGDVGGPEGKPGGSLEVRGVLGEGGMGQVQLALQRSLRREVAVKRLRGEQPNAKRQRYARALLWEARVMGALEHPNITPIHELGLDGDGSPLLVMKRISGESWRRLLENPSHPMWANLEASGRTRRDIHLDILGQLCNALYYAHSFGIVHRDIKPENVMLGAFGEVYLVDWGTATRLPHEGASGVVGTPAYMAPEMAKDGPITPQTDVYLLGATLYEVLAGRPPHNAPTVMASLWKASVNQPPALPSETPSELAAVCARAMHTDPAQRFDSPASLRQALELFRQHHGSREAAQASIERSAELLNILAEPDPDREAVYRVAAECRFGLRLALRQWPDNAEAADALTRCLDALLSFELRAQNPAAVAALLAELPPQSPGRDAAQAALAVLEQELAKAKAAEQARVQRLKLLTDQTTGSRARALTFFVAALVSLGIGVRAIWARVFEGAEVTKADLIWPLVVLLVVVVVVIAVQWRRFGDTPINRRFLSLLLLTILSMLGNRLLGLDFDRPIPQTFIHDLWLIVIVSAATGIALNKWGWWLTALSSVGAVIATLFPQIATITLNLYGPAVLLIVAYMATYQRHRTLT